MTETNPRYPSGRTPLDILKAEPKRIASAFPARPIEATETGWPPPSGGRKPTVEEAEAILTLVRGGWLNLTLTLDGE